MDNAAPRRNWLLISGIVGLLIFGALYFWLFVADDLGSGNGKTIPTVGPAAVENAPARQMFAIQEVNIRDQPTISGSNIIGKLPRGSAVTGILKMGIDGALSWLELAEGKGYIADVNLSETALPVLVKSLDGKVWSADVAVEVWAQPGSSSLIDRVAAGTKLTLLGVTENDYIEIELQQGGVGYIADGAAIIARANGKPLAISFNPQTCNFGTELAGEFEKIAARLRAQWIALEDREYPSEEAREKAMSGIEARSTFKRMQRTYDGLTLTAIGQHFESQSLYFAEPANKVIDVFRAKGFRIGRDGNFPSTELYAGISTTRGEGTNYGKSEIGCGV